MIGKLRKKFILVNMGLVSLVLIIVFAVLCFSTYQRLASESDSALRQALSHGANRSLPKLELGGKLPKDPFFSLPVFCVTLDPNNAVIGVTGNNLEVSQEVLDEAVKSALATDQNGGVLSGLRLRFLRENTKNGGKIAFVDLSRARDSMTDLLVTSLLVGIGGLAAFFLVSLFLANWTLRPVKEAWMRQRQFVADASHELKSPLTVILANTGILLAHPQDTIRQQSKWIENIGSEADRMKKLVNHLLYLAKSDAGRTPVQYTSFNFSDAVWSCLLPFEPLAFEQGLTLCSDIAQDVRLLGDAEALQQVVIILLDNACKYAGENGTITLALKACQDKVRLTVHNTGTPVSPEHLDHLFERFYRADSSRARNAGGFGLGLSIAKSIVDAHGGKISVESSAETGTAFTVCLPVKSAGKTAVVI